MKTSILFVTFLCLFAFTFAKTYFKESFTEGWKDRWVESDWKTDSSRGKFGWTAGNYYNDETNDKGLQTSEDYRFYTISSEFPEFTNKDKTLVLQYTVKNEHKVDCSGQYLKLLPAGLDQKQFNGESPYNIMFGPDACGSSKKKNSCHL